MYDLSWQVKLFLALVSAKNMIQLIRVKK